MRLIRGEKKAEYNGIPRQKWHPKRSVFEAEQVPVGSGSVQGHGVVGGGVGLVYKRSVLQFLASTQKEWQAGTAAHCTSGGAPRATPFQNAANGFIYISRERRTEGGRKGRSAEGRRGKEGEGGRVGILLSCFSFRKCYRIQSSRVLDQAWVSAGHICPHPHPHHHHYPTLAALSLGMESESGEGGGPCGECQHREAGAWTRASV